MGLLCRWETLKEPVVRFVEAKAKLTPLDQNGEAVKVEICGTVYAARLRKYFEKHESRVVPFFRQPNNLRGNSKRKRWIPDLLCKPSRRDPNIWNR